MNTTQYTIRKYTGREVDTMALFSNDATRKLASAIEDAANTVSFTDDSLRASVSRLRDAATKIEKNLDAEPGDMVPSLNELGELQGDRTDSLIAVRAGEISTLKRLVALIP